MKKYRIAQRNDGYYIIQYRVIPFVWSRYISSKTEALYTYLKNAEASVQELLDASKVRKELLNSM